MTTAHTDIAGPGIVQGETLIWTVLPQGFTVDGSGNPVALRLSVFLAPQLAYTETIGVRQVTSTRLSTFPDFVNWPETVNNANLEFNVQFTGGGSTVNLRTYADLTLLVPQYWQAIFGDGSNTRVDSLVAENWTQENVGFTSFGVKALHDYLVVNTQQSSEIDGGVYGSYNYNAVQPGAISPTELQFADQAIVESGVAGAAATLLQFLGSNGENPQPQTPQQSFQDALNFHTVPGNVVAPPPTSLPILDFHSAVASLSAYPELLIAFGLLFPISIDLSNLGSLPGGTVNVSASPQVNQALNLGVGRNVSPVTVCDYGPETSTFLPQPFGIDYATVQNGVRAQSKGMLGLGDTSTGTFSVVDLDVDGAAEVTNSTLSAIGSTMAAGSDTADFSLPQLRTAGLSVIWENWGSPIAADQYPPANSQSQTLSALTWRQAQIATTIASGKAPILYAEDVIRGWRIDVANYSPSTQTAGSWQSLHWRLGSYAFGTGNQYQLTGTTPIEGMVIPGVSHPPLTDGAVTPESILVHESIARWDGWSLSAPRPATGQINDDGSYADAVGNPMPSQDNTDEYGNTNAPIQAEFIVAPAGLSGTDPLWNDSNGTSGLPTLRFGQEYSFRARAVDLGGWSVPLTTPSLVYDLYSSAPVNYGRWESIPSPQLVPTLPTTALLPSEDVFTIVLRSDGALSAPRWPDGQLLNPGVANARWLFPPQTHQQMAEQHGFLDAPDSTGYPSGTLDPLSYETLAQFNEGSISNLENIQGIDQGDPYLLAPDGSAPLTLVTWLPDPGAFGIAIGGLGVAIGGVSPGTAVSQVVPNYSESPGFGLAGAYSTNFLDLWVPRPSEGANDPFQTWFEAWPGIAPDAPANTSPSTSIAGKLFTVSPGPNPSFTGPARSTPGGGSSWDVQAASPTTAEVLSLTVPPGAVYDLTVSSIFPWSFIEAVAQPTTLAAWSGIFNAIPTDVGRDLAIPNMAYLVGGQGNQITPSFTLRVLYAVLLPAVAPSFSTPVVTRSGTTAVFDDQGYTVDPVTTGMVTISAAWTDPYDNPSDPGNTDPGTATVTVTQSLAASVQSPYGISLEDQGSNATVVTGQFTLDEDSESDVIPGGLNLTQQIGDTKYHLVNYTATAIGRFGKYFSETTTVTFGLGDVDGNGLPTAVLSDEGVDANLVHVVIPATANANLVTVPSTYYTVDGASGAISLTQAGSSASLVQGASPAKPGTPAQPGIAAQPGTPAVPGTPVPLLGTALEVTWVPIDTVVGPEFQLPILNSVNPPALKVVKVVPAWSLVETGTAPGSNYSLKRSGNTLRVYLERPWYTTGAGEFLGVIAAQVSDSQPFVTSGLPENVDLSVCSVIGFDPITNPNVAPSVSYSQTQLTFAVSETVPMAGSGSSGGNPALVSSDILQDENALYYTIFSYAPLYDSVSGLWYADVELSSDTSPGDSETLLPPGYFLRLALVRFQPNSTGWNPSTGLYDYISPVTLTTFFQPVSDRVVTVTGGGASLSVTVSGPGYSGWRSATESSASPEFVLDTANTTAAHSNSDGKGSRTTSTMVVEVQTYSQPNGFTGDFGWETISSSPVVLTAAFSSVNPGEVDWSGVVDVPVGSDPVRLQISELDYFPYTPGQDIAVSTLQRRSFVVQIPVS